MPDRLHALPVRIEAAEIVPLERVVADGVRRSNLVRLCGRGEEGRGEDVTFDVADRRALLDAGLPEGLYAAQTVGDVTALLRDCKLTAAPPRWEAVHRYRFWAIEAAALDLALCQGGIGIAEALGRTPSPLHFVVSRKVDGNEDFLDLLRRFPGLSFKLDVTSGWTEAVASTIAASGAVATLDLKGTSPGSSVYLEPDPALYERVSRLFPTVWLEDPGLTPATARVLAAHRARIAWDEPVGSVDDVPVEAGAVNVKPARIGSIQGVLSLLEHCARCAIPVYGGGQSEIGPGRGQAQILASLFYPTAPNDLAPPGYNDAGPGTKLPPSPLAPVAGVTGFRWS
ncbi:MAG: hypothetical protein WCJ67_07950 [Thermoleophilia bacterium]